MRLKSEVSGVVLSTLENDWEFNGKTGTSLTALFFPEQSDNTVKLKVDEKIFSKVSSFANTFKVVTVEIEISIYENKTVLKVIDVFE